MAREIPDGFFDDTNIPNIFIMDSLDKLGHTALKVYLLATSFASRAEKIEAKLIREHLNLSQEEYKAAICELAGHDLVDSDTEFSILKLRDLKRQAVEKYYRRATNTPIKESVERTAANRDQNMLIKSINESFFHGLMGPTWYQAIDTWFHEFSFEPAVVYQMFVDAKERNTLQGPNYLNKVAEDYNRNGVKTFADLSKYKENTKRVRIITREVGKKLNKSMSTYDHEIVEKWVLEYAYDFSVIEVALRNAVRISEPNLNYFDKILETWYKAGLRTAEEVENVEKNRVQLKQKQAAAKSKVGRTSAKPYPIDEREHGEDYYTQFYRFALEEDFDKLMQQGAFTSSQGQEDERDE